MVQGALSLSVQPMIGWNVVLGIYWANRSRNAMRHDLSAGFYAALGNARDCLNLQRENERQDDKN